MRFRIQTLIDITETGQHRGPDRLAMNQQANLNSVIQVIALRANPTPLKITQHTDSMSNMKFGSNYKGKHAYWEFEFEIEYGETTLDYLIDDFHLVPVITGLNNTAEINIAVFDTKDSKTKNTVFEKIL